jgi:HEAT repeat protein
MLAKSSSRDVARALGNIGPSARAAIPVLSEMLKGADGLPREGTDVGESRDDAADRRIAACLALWKIARQTKGIPSLISILEDKDRVFRKGHSWVRIASAQAVGDMGPSARAAVPCLIGALEDEDGAIREAAARALGGVGSEAKEAVPALRAALRNQWAGEAAAVALGNMGQIASAAGPDLEAVLDVQALRSNGDYYRQIAAADALGKVSGPTDKSIGVLLAALRFYGFPQMAGPRSYIARNAARIRQRAAVMLGDLGPPAKPAIPALAEVARADEFFTVRSAAAKAIWRIDPRDAATRMAR